MQAIVILLLVIQFTKYSNSNQEVIDKFAETFPYFRLKMEEVFGDQMRETVGESIGDNFVPFLVDNVKDLFTQSNNSSLIPSYENSQIDPASLLGSLRSSTQMVPNKTATANKLLITDDYYLPFILTNNDINSNKSNTANQTNVDLLHILKNLKPTSNKLKNDSLSQLRRLCISCNNVLNEDCSSPELKLVPSIECQREDDLCYSQHTPFGIIDRGCFNVNNDLTVFVCACNLCNYISISEMPYLFSNKKDWVENVIELSRAKRFRDSIFKDMSCLRCAVDVSTERGNMVADTNCLEGNIANLPRQICRADEICGVKAIRSKGYIWRGCITEPLYNYWWNLCDDDLCNFDSVISIYDIENNKLK